MPGAGAPVTANPQPKIHPCHPAANRQAWEQPLHFHASHASRCGVASVSRAPEHPPTPHNPPRPVTHRMHHTHTHHRTTRTLRRLAPPRTTPVAGSRLARSSLPEPSPGTVRQAWRAAAAAAAAADSAICDLRTAPSSCTSGNLLLPAAVQLISRDATISKFG